MTLPADFDRWLTTPPDDEPAPECRPGTWCDNCADCSHPDL